MLGVWREISVVFGFYVLSVGRGGGGAHSDVTHMSMLDMDNSSSSSSSL